MRIIGYKSLIAEMEEGDAIQLHVRNNLILKKVVDGKKMVMFKVEKDE